MGFFAGCRPYISLDACHLKGKFNGVLVAATGIDGNSSMFPVAYGILESENTSSWIWFLELLKKVIGMPHGLVISSDMQKGLKGTAKTYSVNVHDRLLNDIAGVSEKAITYLHDNKKGCKKMERYISSCCENLSQEYLKGEKIFPSIFKRPIGRPRKNRIVAHDESKRKKDVQDVLRLDIMKKVARTRHLRRDLKNLKHLQAKGTLGLSTNGTVLVRFTFYLRLRQNATKIHPQP
nr:hypothetical protein [Tanacetum cinerariifolium]GEZ15533.1 hypothetical protein [Tanacetum cinerariifolium]